MTNTDHTRDPNRPHDPATDAAAARAPAGTTPGAPVGTPAGHMRAREGVVTRGGAVRGHDTARNRDPERIEDEIEHTRSRIETNLDKLSAQFTPSNLVERALGTNPATGEGDSFAVMLDRARANPIGAALVLAGLASMALKKEKARPARIYSDRRVADQPIEPYSKDPAERIAHNISALETQADALRDDVAATAGSIKDSVSSTVETIADKASDVVDRVSGTVKRSGEAYEGARERSAHVYSTARHRVRTAPRRARSGTEYVADWIVENPLPSGLFALAVGAAVATAVTAANADAPRRHRRDFDGEYDRDAAARATRTRPAYGARREHATMPVPAPTTAATPADAPATKPVPAATAASQTASKPAAKPAAPKKTAPLLKTAPDTGSTSILPSEAGSDKSRS